MSVRAGYIKYQPILAILIVTYSNKYHHQLYNVHNIHKKNTLHFFLSRKFSYFSFHFYCEWSELGLCCLRRRYLVTKILFKSQTNNLSRSFFSIMEVKIALILYTMFVLCVPLTPNLYTIIVTILGTIVAVGSAIVSLLYFRSLPSVQFTCAKPLIMSIMVLATIMSIEDCVIAITAYLFHNEIEKLLDLYPLTTCGFVNQRPLAILTLLCLILLGISKMVLLVNPMTYHAADHELLSFRCFLGLAAYFVIDVLLYLTLGNTHYCHPDTLNGYAMHYKFDLQIKLEDFAHVSLYHRLFDFLCIVVLLALELIIQVLTWKTNRRISAARRPINAIKNMESPRQSANQHGIQPYSEVSQENESQQPQNSNEQYNSDIRISIESDNQVSQGPDKSVPPEQEVRPSPRPQLPQYPVPEQVDPPIILVVRSLENQQSSNQTQRPHSNPLRMLSSPLSQPGSNQQDYQENPPVNQPQISLPPKRFKLISIHTTLITFLYTISIIGILSISN